MRFGTFLVCILTLAISMASAAMAGDADFTLRNKTGYQIDEVYVSSSASKNWGKDIMGKDSLDDGEHVKIVFPRRSDACIFDIKVKYEDGDEAEWGGVDLCKYDVITLHWDKAKQVTRAVGE